MREEPDGLYLNNGEAAKYLGASLTTFQKYRDQEPLLITVEGEKKQVLLKDLKRKFLGEPRIDYYKQSYLDEIKKDLDEKAHYVNASNGAKYLKISLVTFQKYRDTMPFFVEENGEKKQVLLKDRKRHFLFEDRVDWYRKSDLDAMKQLVEQ